MSGSERWRRRRGTTVAVLALTAVLSALAAPLQSHAHALLDRGDPAPGVAIPADRPPRSVSLWFTEPVEVVPDAVAVFDADHRRVERRNARVSPENPGRVDVDLGDLAQGAYLVRWRVTSADSHVVRGSFWFVVGFAAAPPPAAELLGTSESRLPPIETIARWLGLMALMIMAGAPLFRLAVLRPTASRLSSGLWPQPSRSTERNAWLAVTTAFLVAHCVRAAAQSEAVAEVPLPQALSAPILGEVLFASRFAILWWLQLITGMGLGALLFSQAGRKGASESGLGGSGLAALVGVLLLIASSLGSHAIGARIAPPLAVASDSVHLAAAALWLGGLVELGLFLPPVLAHPGAERSAVLRLLVPRVSAIFFTSVLVLVATGLFNTWEQVATLDALLTTAYGQSLLLKLGILVPLLAIAAVNLLILRPRIAAGGAEQMRLPQRFLANVRAEIILGAFLLLAATMLTTLPPTAQQALPAPIEIGRQAGDLHINLRADPVWVGVSRFQVTLADGQGLAPADVRQVVLTFTMEGMNMGRTNVTMSPRGGGVYEAEGFYIGMPGISRIGVAVNRAGAEDRTAVFRIEVPDVNPKRFAGLPAALGIGGAFPGVAGAPVPANPASLARGRQLYDEHCATCHGATGIGNGPAAPSLLPPPADLTLHARWHSDEQLHWFIAHGVPGTSMVAFRERMSATENWDVINHLHELARAPTATALRPTPVKPSQLAAAIPSSQSAPQGTGESRPSSAPVPSPLLSTEAMTDASEASTLTGRLVFGPDYDNNLWLLRLPDGKPEPLTRFGPKEFSSNPAWSRDGEQIAFSYYRLPEEGQIPVPDGTDLYVMNADGSGVRPLALHETRGAAFQHPAWAANGSAVYVSHAAPTMLAPSIERVSVKSGTRSRIVSNAAYPALSRDGRSLAYVRYATPPDRGESLWSSAPDGSRPRQIIGPAVFAKYFGLRFSPDDRRLIFAAVGQPSDAKLSSTGPHRLLSLLGRALWIRPAHANGDLWDLWVVDLDGRNLRPLTALQEDMPIAAWSPDGRQVAFLGGGSANSAQAGVTIIAPGRRDLRRLTTQPGHRGLDWAPSSRMR